MKTEDANSKSVGRTIFDSVLVIVWWVSIWGITEYVVHHVNSKNPFRVFITYIGLLLMVLGVVYLDERIANKL
jgi:hypothetical protein